MEEQKIPSKIKQDGYIAEWNGKFYEVEYMRGGHWPEIGFILLTHPEMEKVYLDVNLYSKIMIEAEKYQVKRTADNKRPSMKLT